MADGSGDRPHRVVLLGLALAATGSAGCYKVPPGKSAVARLEIEGLEEVEEGAVAERIATVESPRFLGIASGVVYEYSVLDRYALRRDLSRIERYLRARGFYEARVRAARVVTRGDKAYVTIEVEEGEPVTIASVTILGDRALAREDREAMARAAREHAAVGARFDEDEFADAEEAMRDALTARGYAAATVERHAEVDLASKEATLRFTVEPGPVATLGPIRFVGLGDLDEADVRRVFGLEQGELYSSEEIELSRLALLDLGVFASVEVEPDLSQIERTRTVPLTVRTEPAKLRALLAGFGFQFDALKTDVHTMVGWQSANFLGGLRRFEVRFKPGIVLYPTRLPDVQAPEKILGEQRLIATLRQPAFLERRTAGVVRAEYNIYPILLPGSLDPENLAGYHEVRAELGLERSFGRVFASPQYGAQANFPFDYLGSNPELQPLFISYTEVFSYLDLRNDPVRPRRGLYLGAELQSAGGPLQGDADDVRVQPELRGFIPLLRGVTLAMRASVGFLFPRNYGGAARAAARGSSFEIDENLARDYQLLFFRGFFGGGPSSNRGYPLRGIGPHALIPRASPAGQSIAAAGCAPEATFCTLPTGGQSMWEANVEARVVVAGPFSTAFFCDAGDVSPYPVNVRLERLHLSCGTGARYDTPVGPVRLDIGYRIPGLQFPDGARGELVPRPLLGLPVVLSFGIGEAF